MAKDIDRAARPVDQTVGQAGLTAEAEGVAWKCLIIGCGTGNHFLNSQCASCLSPPPTPEMMRRARLYHDRLAREKQALVDSHMEQLDSIRLQYASELQSARSSLEGVTRTVLAVEERVEQLLSQLDLLAFATTGNIKVLQELDRIGALERISDVVNKTFSFKTYFTSCTVSASQHQHQPVLTISVWCVQSMTALQIASYNGHKIVVELLLKVPDIKVNFQEEGVCISIARSICVTSVVEWIYCSDVRQLSRSHSDCAGTAGREKGGTQQAKQNIGKLTIMICYFCADISCCDTTGQ